LTGTGSFSCDDTAIGGDNLVSASELTALAFEVLDGARTVVAVYRLAGQIPGFSFNFQPDTETVRQGAPGSFRSSTAFAFDGASGGGWWPAVLRHVHRRHRRIGVLPGRCAPWRRSDRVDPVVRSGAGPGIARPAGRGRGRARDRTAPQGLTPSISRRGLVRVAPRRQPVSQRLVGRS
jgi:hypothetical protein